jgi:hypothetical protein
MDKTSRRKPHLRGSFSFVAIVMVALVSASAYAFDQHFFFFIPGNLVVSRTVYDNNPANISVGESLPPGCTSGCVAATNNGTYPQVFNNNLVDGSFGITSKIFLDQITPFGFRFGTLEVPNSNSGSRLSGVR